MGERQGEQGGSVDQRSEVKPWALPVPAPDAHSPATCAVHEEGNKERVPGHGGNVPVLHPLSPTAQGEQPLGSLILSPTPGERQDSVHIYPATPGCSSPHRTRGSAVLLEMGLFGDGEVMWSVTPQRP